MGNFDQLKLAVEGISGGKNTIILDNLNMPSYMVRIPQMKYADLITGGTQDIHDAHILDGNALDVVYIGKYQSCVVNSRAYSLPFKDPAASLDFDTARTYCRNKGAGWHLQTNALWSLVALLCKKAGTMPHGNNYYGQDTEFAYEKGVPSMARDTSNRIQRCATGSGPNTWYHDYNSATGIADMNGNVWEWCGGLRLVAGEIQVIPYANAMKDIYSGSQDIQSPTSSLWQAIMPDGTFVNPGTAGTLKLDYVSSHWQLCTTITSLSDSSRNAEFGLTTVVAGVSVPQIVKGLCLYPDDTVSANYKGDRFYANNGAAERLPNRGGDWDNAADAGVFALALNSPRSGAHTGIGFRSAFYGTL